ncbi:MAG TPA: hypothetical protein VMZ25_10615 [Terriglobales bacterium]|nr:hypothetical protein [Terriglobales bacterium]
MRSQFEVHSGSPEGFIPRLAETSLGERRRVADAPEQFRLAAEAAGLRKSFFARIDWTAVGAAAFVYAVAFAAWSWLAK